MKRGFYTTVICCMAFAASAQTHNYIPALMQTTTISFIVADQLVNNPDKNILKKVSLYERILMKWYKKKIHKKVSEEKQKKNVKLLGFFSLGAALLSPILSILLFGITAYGVVEILAIFALLLLPAAIILGIISLNKRKKLSDKTGTSKVPALIGIILGSLFLIVLVSLFASVRFNSNTF